MNEPNDSIFVTRVPASLKRELANVAKYRETSPSELARQWLFLLVETHKLEEEFKTVHIQPDLSVENLKHYCESNDINQLVKNFSDRKIELRVMREIQDKELAELDRISDAIVKMYAHYLDHITGSERNAEPSDE